MTNPPNQRQLNRHLLYLVGLGCGWSVYLGLHLLFSSSIDWWQRQSAAFLAEPSQLSAVAASPRLDATEAAAYRSIAQPDTQSMRLEIRLAQRQVVLYQDEQLIKSYPIAIGRRGWETPQGSYQVKQKFKNPTWINPLTDQVIPGGSPDNPLGNYWIGFWTNGRNWIGFHGTPNPESVGKAASHGCIRMYNQDVKELFQTVKLGTTVVVLP